MNNKQGVIKTIDTDFNVFTVEFTIQTKDFTAYTSGGTASRVIPFSALSKKFNPFVNIDKKIKDLGKHLPKVSPNLVAEALGAEESKMIYREFFLPKFL